MQVMMEIVLVFFLTTQSAYSMQEINVLYVNDIKNEAADKFVTVALNYLNLNKHFGIQIGTFVNVTAHHDDAKELHYRLHTEYNNSISMNKPFHLVLDTTLRKPTSEVVKIFTAEVAVPTISTTCGQTGDIRGWHNLKKEELKYLIQISPPDDIIPEIVRSIVFTQKMTNAGIFFDNSFVMDHKYKSLLRNVPTRHILIQINDVKSVKNHLIRLKDMDIVNYFIIGHLSTTIKSVLEIADSNNFVGKTFAWQAITQDDGLLVSNSSNITVLFVKPDHDHETMANQEHLFNIFHNYSVQSSSEVESAFYFHLTIRSLLAIKSLFDSGEWIHNTSNELTIPSSTRNQTKTTFDLRKHFKKVKGPVSYGQFLLESNGKSFMEFNMTLEKVQIRNGQPISVDTMGMWKAGLNSSIKVNNVSEMANLSAVTVYKVVTALQEPFMMKDVDEFGNEKYYGYCIDLIEEIRKMVPVTFEYEMYTTPDNSFGFMSESGHWNGMIKELIEKRADIALGTLTVLAERENVVDFTIAYYDLVGIAIMMKTFKSSTSLFKFLEVMENHVWLCILAAYFFTSLLLWMLEKWSPYSSQNTCWEFEKCNELPRRFNLIECLWFCMTSLTPQGGGEAPQNISGRIVSATWWLFGLIIISSYTANLAAFLTVSRLDTPIESLDDLYKQYKIQYAPVNGSAAMTYFQRMADIEGRFRQIWKDMSLNSSLSDVERAKLAVWEYPISNKYTKIWKAMTQAKAPNSTMDATLRVLASKSSSEGFAYLGDATEIRYQVMINCDLKMVGDEFSRKPYAIAVQKGSPLKDQFDSAILQLLNVRKLEQMKEQWWNLNPVKKICEKHMEQSDSISIHNIGNNPDLPEYTEPAHGATKKVSHLSIGNIQTIEIGGVFIVIFVGMVLACISLMLEYCYKFHKSPSVRPVTRKTTMQNHFHQRNMKNILCIKSLAEDLATRY